MSDENPVVGTFTGFVQSLAAHGIRHFEVSFPPGQVKLRVERLSKHGEVFLPLGMIEAAEEDILLVELGEIINAVL